MDSFALRIKGQERHLYAGRRLYVGIRRDWQEGSRLFFVDKAQDDVIVGSGIFERIVELDGMDEQEHKLCLQNNWYGRMMLERVERFLPPVPVSCTPLAGVKSVLLHGFAVSEEQALEIDSLVASKIIS